MTNAKTTTTTTHDPGLNPNLQDTETLEMQGEEKQCHHHHHQKTKDA